jgi:glycerol uptake facilitator-like aquaporin
LTHCRYAMETMVSFAIIFIAFGVGLDPRQKEVFGPALSPILVCLLPLSPMSSIPHKPVDWSSTRTLHFRVLDCQGWICRSMYVARRAAVTELTNEALNPARCLGLMAAAGRSSYLIMTASDAIVDNFEYHYVHWFGGMTAAVLNGIMYWAIPIYNQ